MNIQLKENYSRSTANAVSCSDDPGIGDEHAPAGVGVVRLVLISLTIVTQDLEGALVGVLPNLGIATW